MYFPYAPPPMIDKRADVNHTGPVRAINTIREIILHATVGGFQSSLDWLTTQSNNANGGTVSVHILIDKDGTIYRIVPDTNIAFHAGYSTVGTKKNRNPTSLGIELVNRNDGIDPYPDAQVVAAARVVMYWRSLYGELNLFTHADIDTNGKTDPAGFKWREFLDLLNSMRQRVGGAGGFQSELKDMKTCADQLSMQLQALIARQP